MKLKCDKHGRRVLTGKDGFLHRTGDMSPCDSKTASIGDEQITSDQIPDGTHVPPEQQLLNDIFKGSAAANPIDVDLTRNR